MQKMKIVFSVFLTFILISCGNEFTEKFSIVPDSPQPGSELTVNYNPAGTDLEKSESIEMVVYQYDVDLESTTGFVMNKKGNGWTAKFTPAENTKGFIAVFKSGENKDNNDSKGYVKYLSGKEGAVLPRAKAGFAVAQATWSGWYLELAYDSEMALNTFEEVFKDNEYLKSKYLTDYLNVLSKVKKEAADSLINAELQTLAGKEELTEKDLEILASMYMKIKNSAESEKYKNLLLEKFPEGEFAQNMEYSKIHAVQNPDEMFDAAVEFSKKFPESDRIGVAFYYVNKKYVDQGNFKKSFALLNEYKNVIHPYAFSYTVNKLIENGKSDEMLLKIAELGSESAAANLENPKGEKPNYLTVADWQKERESTYASGLFDYARALNLNGEKENALSAAEKAVGIMKSDEAELNELYAILLVDLGRIEEAQSKMEEFIKAGKSTGSMMALFEKVYAEIHGSADGYDEYLAKFTTVANAKMIEELKKEMIEESAPDFELVDLNGNKVKLKDYAGKTVIIDFWATWCGPCKASFPGMQMTVNKFKDNDNVQFLFVNTWERVADDMKKDNAGKFITDNNYTFHVLLDIKNEVVSKYNVSGIPTKFIIDKNQNIRFKSIGFAGTAEHQVDELSAMIQLCK